MSRLLPLLVVLLFASPLRAEEPPPLDAAKALLQSGDFAGAAEGFRAALRANPADATARSYLAECHLALGETELASAVAAGGDPDGLIFGLPTVVPAPVEAEPAKVEAEPAEAAPVEAEPAKVEAEPAEAAPRPKAEKPPKDWNPRAKNRGGVGVAAFAPIGGGGIWIEGRPHWVLGFVGSAGVAAWAHNGDALGVGGLAVEAVFTPVPLLVGPELGVGFLGLFGSGAWAITDGRLVAPLMGENRRGTPYGRLAFRIDGRRWTMSVGAVVVGGPGGRPVGMPSFRIGGTFR